MLRVSKLTDYAVVVLTRLSEGEQVMTSPAISQLTGVPEPTVAKVLKALGTAGFVQSQRGARGGYRLAQGLDRITIADVIAAIEGPIALTACVDGGVGGCDVHTMCAVKGRWDPVNDGVRRALSAITVADMFVASVPLMFRAQAPAFAESPAFAEPFVE